MTDDLTPYCIALSDSVAERVGAARRAWASTVWTFQSEVRKRSRQRRHHHLVVARLDEITRELVRSIADMGKGKARYLLLTRGLPPQALSERVARLRIGDARRLHIAGASTAREERELVGRLARLHAPGAPQHAILDAWWEHDTLVVLSPRFDRLHVPGSTLSDAFPALARLSKSGFISPTIHPDGAYLHWARADVHLGWEELHELVDMKARLKATQSRSAFRRRHGAAIRSFRIEQELTQADVAGLAQRHLRRIEHGEQELTANALDALAEAHGMQPVEYLDAVVQRMADTAGG